MSRLSLTTAGESHGPGLTAILRGMPSGHTVDFELLRRDMQRRMHGHGRGRRMKIETDEIEIRGGLRGGVTLGSPIALWISNRDFDNWRDAMDPEATDADAVESRRIRSPRPGHADLAGSLKYLPADLREVLERASARESAARVAAGAVAKSLLAELGIEVRSGVRSLGPIAAAADAPCWEEMLAVDENSPLRAIDRELEPAMVALVDEMTAAGETIGGAVTIIAHNVPAGLGSFTHWDEKLDGRLARALMSVPAIKAVEIGGALEAARGPGSEAHDAIEHDGRTWRRPTNRAGGLEGGVTNGTDVVLTAFMKPISTLAKGLPSVDLDTLEPQRSQYERSDITALPAAGVIGEAMTAFVLADALLEKVGGDSMLEVKAHFEATLDLQRRWPRG